MTTPELALRAFVRRRDLAPLDAYPSIWAGHYDDYGFILGEYGIPSVPRGRLAEACMGLMIPFGLTDQIQASYLIVDALSVDGADLYFEMGKVLYISSLQTSGAGILVTHWTVPFLAIRDLRQVYGEPEKAWSKIPSLDAALSEIMDYRLAQPRADFETAYEAALMVMQDSF